MMLIPDSPRLRFRLMDGRNDADARLWFELDQDPEVMRFLNDGKPTPWEEVVSFFVPRASAFTDPEKGHGVWEVRDRETAEYLGWILVREYGFSTHLHEPDNIELGWRLKRHCWGQGIATEAAGAIMEVLAGNSSIRAFCAIADPENLGSIGVMKKLGMTFVDNRIHYTPKQDMPVAYYEMASPGFLPASA